MDGKTSIFSRVEQGVGEILDMIQKDDINKVLLESLVKHIDEYDRVLKPGRDVLRNRMQEEIVVISEVLYHHDYESDAIRLMWMNRQNPNWNEHQLKNILELMKKQRNILTATSLAVNTFTHRFRVSKPYRLYPSAHLNMTARLTAKTSSGKEPDICVDNAKRLQLINLTTLYIDELETFGSKLNESTDYKSWEPPVDINAWPDSNNQTYVELLKSHQDDLLACIGFLTEYREELVQAKESINNTAFEAPYIFSDSLRGTDVMEMRFLEESYAWLDSLYRAYAAGEKTVVDLHHDFYTTDRDSEIINRMENLQQIVRLRVSVPLVDALAQYEQHLFSLYKGVLDDVERLVPYFGNRIRHELIHRLSVWRQPVARFDNPTILHLELTAEQGN